MTHNETIALLRLQRIPSVGPINARKLLAHFGGPEAVFKVSGQDLMQLPGIGPVLAQNLLNNQFLRDAEGEMESVVKRGIQVLGYGDAGYPAFLKECEDAPLLLFFKGKSLFSGKRMISLVGTRNMTGYGRRTCEAIIEYLRPYDPVIVSGMAVGVDICAHLAAIDKGLPTIACLAHGLDITYPQTHEKYIGDLCLKGGLLSEFWLGTPPEPMHFVRRNRIIAGMSSATIVVESASRGGSLITADLAFGYDREVFAIPGRVGDHYSEGCNLLIRQQKAHLLHSPADLPKALRWEPRGMEDPISKKDVLETLPLNIEERYILEYLAKKDNVLQDEIASNCKISVGELASLLLGLELRDLIEPLPGKRFRLGATAYRPGGRFRESCDNGY